MKIKNIKINSFGNLEDKELELSDKINIIYGKNETGKSTLLKFIDNTFYGTSKNKKGREYSDYDRYKPWGKDDFSGKIKYQLDNNEEYEVYREFSKKNPKIYNSNLEDISKKFSIDKNLGNQFFYEQTKVDEDTFLSTIASMQQEVRLEKNSQNILIQKMANIAGTGEDNVSYQKALDKLYKKQLDEIGTYRSQGKPINIAQEKLNELKNKRQELLNYKDQKYDFEENKNDIDEKIKKSEIEIELLKEVKVINEREKLEKGKLEYNKTLIDEKEQELQSLINEKNDFLKKNNRESEQHLENIIHNCEKQLSQDFDYRSAHFDLSNSLENEQSHLTINKKDTEPNSLNNSKFKDEGNGNSKNIINNSNNNQKNASGRKNQNAKISITKYIVLIFIVVIINVFLYISIKDNLLKYIGLAGFPIILLIYILEKNKIKKSALIRKNKENINKKVEQNKILINLDKNKKLLEQVNLKNAKISVIQKDRNNEIEKLIQIQEKIKSVKNIEKEKLKNTYREKMDIYEINKILNIENVDYELEKLQNRINEEKLELHKIDLKKDNIMPQLDDLAKIEEEISITQENYDNLIKKNNSIIVAKQALENAYEKMKKSVTPKFTNNLSENISKISNGKYNKVSINDENGLMVERSSGEYVSADRLSLGTIDQLYLSLRLSMSTEISSENMPIILDEAFAYYDDERLQNILKYLADNYSDKQIIILTCTNREEDIFKKLGYEFNKVNL